MSVQTTLSQLFAAGLVLATSPFLGAEDWVTVSPKDGGFSVSMPSQPETDDSVDHTIIGAIGQNLYTVTLTSESFSAEYSKLPGAVVDLAGQGRIFEEAVKNLLKTDRAKKVSLADITFDGHPGKEVHYRAGDQHGTARMYLVEDHFYVLDASVGPDGDASDITRFLDSFQLTGD